MTDIKITPKQKAKDLYDKFYKEIPTRLMHYDLHHKLAKDLSLICVEENASAHYDFGNAYALTVEERMYYDNVKREIEKL